MGGIMEAEEDEFSIHFDSIDNKRAIYEIDTQTIEDSTVLSEAIQQSEDSDSKNKRITYRRIMNTLKGLVFTNLWINSS